MKLHSFTFDVAKGWSISEFPKISGVDGLVLVFGAPVYGLQTAPIEDLVSAYPRTHVVGCSSAGEIFQDKVNDNSLSVAVLDFEGTKVQAASASIESAEKSESVGRELAIQLDHPTLKAVFILSEGLSVNGSELVKGFNSVLSKNVIVTGGLAADGSRFKSTWVLKDGAPKSGVVTAVGFYGNRVRVGHGSRGGWDIFGPERVITRSRGNILYELDRKPALQLYKEYLGERASGLPATGLLFPLSLRAGKNADKRLVRTVLAVDESQQSMTFAGDMPQGHLAQLMSANFDRLIDGATQAAGKIASRDEVLGDQLVIAISCVGRRLVLGERTEEECESTLDALPAGTQQIGFYSYGEISPFVVGEPCDLHNQTMTLTTISESKT
jgi:hypothetical protein